MSEPTSGELQILKEVQGDDEAYHIYFDSILEAKLLLLDPEWLKAMRELYDKSGMSRWCA